MAKRSELANGERISGGGIIHRECEFAKGSRIMARGKNWGILRRRRKLKQGDSSAVVSILYKQERTS